MNDGLLFEPLNETRSELRFLVAYAQLPTVVFAPSEHSSVCECHSVPSSRARNDVAHIHAIEGRAYEAVRPEEARKLRGRHLLGVSRVSESSRTTADNNGSFHRQSSTIHSKR